MSFADAAAETRERFTEALALANHLRSIAPQDLTPLDDIQKTQRGLWLVSLYAAFERGTNAIVEASLSEISSHGTKSIDCTPALHSIIHFPRVQSVKDCGYAKLLDSSIRLFDASLGSTPANVQDNPLADYLQNVDGGTLEWVCTLFGTPAYSITGANRGRISNLRERRNAVAHGRESASKVGERYTLDEMMNVYQAADSELTRFHLHMESYCTGKLYVRRVA